MLSELPTLTSVTSQIENLKSYIPQQPSIYFLFAQKDLIYIGKSINLDARIKEHKKNKKFDQVLHINFPESRLESIETALIRFYQPILNEQKKLSMTEQDEVILETYCGITI